MVLPEHRQEGLPQQVVVLLQQRLVDLQTGWGGPEVLLTQGRLGSPRAAGLTGVQGGAGLGRQGTTLLRQRLVDLLGGVERLAVQRRLAAQREAAGAWVAWSGE